MFRLISKNVRYVLKLLKKIIESLDIRCSQRFMLCPILRRTHSGIMAAVKPIGRSSRRRWESPVLAARFARGYRRFLSEISRSNSPFPGTRSNTVKARDKKWKDRYQGDSEYGRTRACHAHFLFRITFSTVHVCSIVPWNAASCVSRTSIRTEGKKREKSRDLPLRSSDTETNRRRFTTLGTELVPTKRKRWNEFTWTLERHPHHYSLNMDYFKFHIDRIGNRTFRF